MATGLNAQIGYAVEGTPGTYETVTRFFEFVPPLGLRKIPTQQKSGGIRANRIMPHAVANGPYTVEGSVTHELTAESTGILLEATIDGSPATTGSNPYEHVFEPGDINSISAQVGLPSTSAVHPISYAGLRARGWSLTNDPSGVFPRLTIDWIGMTADIDGTPSLASASYASFTRFTFAHAVFSVAGSELCVDSFTLNGTTGWESEHKICSTNPGAPTLFRAAGPTVTGTAVTDLAALTQLGRLIDGTQVAVDITYTNGASAILQLAGNAYFTGEPATVEGPGKTKETISFEFLHATADASAFTTTLTNADSAA